MSCFIAATANLFAADKLYRKETAEKCWTNLIVNCKFDDNNLQNINLEDMQKLFFRHSDQIIFQQREIRLLQCLLSKYKPVVGDYGYQVGETKSS